MKKINWEALLPTFKLFHDLNDEQLAQFLKLSEPVSYDTDKLILKEGEVDQSSDLYFIGSGAISIALSGVGDNNILVDTMGAGEFFGEMSWLEKKPRSASVFASEPCQLRKISGQNFQKIMNTNAVFASRIASTLSERLRRLTEYVLTVKLKDFDEKLALTNTKMDASLKSIEAQQKAAQTVFDGVNMRANEVINNADRSRQRMTFVLSTLATIATAAGLFLGNNFLNVQEKLQTSNENLTIIEKDIGTKIKALQANADKAEEQLLNFKTKKKEINKLIASTEEQYKQSASKYEELDKKDSTLMVGLIGITADIKSSMGRPQRKDSSTMNEQIAHLQGYHLDAVMDDLFYGASLQELRQDDSLILELYKQTLDFGNADLTEQLFKKLQAFIAQPLQTDKVIELLKIGLDKNWADSSTRQKGLMYYYILAGLLLTDDTVAFEKYFSEYQDYINVEFNNVKFVNNKTKPIYLKQDFSPSWFDEIKRHGENINTKHNSDIMYEIWRKLPRQ